MYNNSAYLDFGIGVGNAPVWCQPYRGIFFVYYIDKFMLMEAPWGDEIFKIYSAKIPMSSNASTNVSLSIGGYLSPPIITGFT